MRKSKIFFLSAEIYPFVQGGRNGEFAGSLPAYLQMAGHEVRVLMPKYSLINERKYIIRDIIRLKDMPVPFMKDSVKVSVKSGFLPETKTQAYFADYEPYFKRADLYRDRKTGLFFKDNDERYALLARTAVETLKTLGWQPDIIHCCDWPTGLLAAVIRHEQKLNNFFKKTVLVFSVNDLQETGLFDRAVFEKALIGDNSADLQKMLHNNKPSGLKMGLACADAVLISEDDKRLKSIAQPKTDFEKIMATAKNIYEIPYGANHNYWNPGNNILEKAYSVDKYYRRQVNRENFLQARRTGFNASEFILGIMTDNVEEDGAAIADMLKALKDMPLQILLLSDKSVSVHSGLKSQTARPGNLKIHNIADPDDQSKFYFYAASDLFTIPSKDAYQHRHYANGMHFGSVPLIQQKAAVIRHFEPIKAKTASGLAFHYDQLRELPAIIAQCREWHSESALWESLAIRLMKADLSWNKSLPHVIRVYEKALSKLK